jgi:hypothetical protein
VVEALEAVEAFEQAVEAHGGDLMVDSYPAAEPDDERFVLPMRTNEESLVRYAGRVRAATDELGGPRAD